LSEIGWGTAVPQTSCFGPFGPSNNHIIFFERILDSHTALNIFLGAMMSMYCLHYGHGEKCNYFNELKYCLK